MSANTEDHPKFLRLVLFTDGTFRFTWWNQPLIYFTKQEAIKLCHNNPNATIVQPTRHVTDSVEDDS